ncbi:MAG: VWA domain-containing protein [Vicinamibacterales bacterium]
MRMASRPAQGRPRRLVAATAIAGICAVVFPGVLARQAQEPPTFRAGVDVIQLDVSVLDKDRRPVRGLTLADFTVLENGKPQRLVAATGVDAADRDPVQSAWMQYVVEDVAVNDLGDALGDGRLFAIVFDDKNLPGDDTDIIVSARQAARHAIDQMGPSDMAAVVFAQQAGKTQDFTRDRQKLLAAIDKLNPNPPQWIEPPSGARPPIQGDIQRTSGLRSRSVPELEQPAVPTLAAVVSRMSLLPNRRKAILFVTVGVPVTFSDQRCAVLPQTMKTVFRRAQLANVNIHTIDPGGYSGYREYLRLRLARYGRDLGMRGQCMPATDVRQLHDFMRITADNTGGRAIVETDAVETGIDRIFEEDGSYYLVSYQTANPEPDGKFRKVEVKVGRPGLTVMTRSGYWAPSRGGGSAETRLAGAPTSTELTLAGLAALPGLPVQLNVVPIGRAAGADLADLAIALTTRLPNVQGQAADTLTLTRTVYDADGRPGPPQREVVSLPAGPVPAEEHPFGILRRMTLAPGRYQVGYTVQSALAGKSGSVYTDLEVPNFSGAALTVSGLVLGSAPGAGAMLDGPLAGLLPIVPTTAREFSRSDVVSAFVRIAQGGSTPLTGVTMKTELFSGSNAAALSESATLPAAAFDTGRSADYQVKLPLDRLAHGPYLLSITARTEGGRTSRRDLLFRMR